MCCPRRATANDEQNWPLLVAAAAKPHSSGGCRLLCHFHQQVTARDHVCPFLPRLLFVAFMAEINLHPALAARRLHESSWWLRDMTIVKEPPMTGSRNAPSDADSASSRDTTVSQDNNSGSASVTCQTTHWANLIANGQVRFPVGLSEQDAERLRAEVARLRRRRLVKFIAKCIAQDIHRSDADSTRRL
jgi:hypothetical protein